VKLRISYRHSADTDRHKQTDTRRSHASGSDAHEMRQIIADIHESLNGLTNKHSCSVIKRHQAPFFLDERCVQKRGQDVQPAEDSLEEVFA